MRKSFFVSYPLSLAALFPAPAAFAFQSISSTVSTATGQIQGQVVLDSSGSPLAGATITAYRITPAPTVSATAISAANGDFAISGLPAGQFGICVKTSNPSLIDPCRWAELRTTVSVTNGKVSSAATVRVKASTPLTMRVTIPASFSARSPRTRPLHT